MFVGGNDRRLSLCRFALLVLALSVLKPDPRNTLRATESSHLAFVGVTVLPMDAPRRLQDQVVGVAGGRIVALGAPASVVYPADARVVRAPGKFLMPGLCDMHVHLRHAEESALRDYVEAGITAVRDMNGRPKLLVWRERIRRGELDGPHLYVACPTIGNWSSPKEGYPTPRDGNAGREAVRRFTREGYDWIKVYSFLPQEAFLGIMAEAKAAGIPVGGHVPIDVPLEVALSAGMHSIEHLTGYLDATMTAETRAQDARDQRSVFHAGVIDGPTLSAVARATAATRVWNCPTLVYFDRILPTERVREAWEKPELRRQGWQNRRQIVRALHDVGSQLVVGTDSDAGDDLPARVIHEELTAMQEAGLSAWEVLRAATLGAARLLGQEQEFGTVAVGKRADLILLDEDPLEKRETLRRPRMVLVGGRVVMARAGGAGRTEK